MFLSLMLTITMLLPFVYLLLHHQYQGIRRIARHSQSFCLFQPRIAVTVGLDDQLYPHLKQSVELSLQYLPGLGVLCGDLEGQGHGLPGEALVQRYQSTVHPTLYQVTGVVLGIFQW